MKKINLLWLFMAFIPALLYAQKWNELSKKTMMMMKRTLLLGLVFLGWITSFAQIKGNNIQVSITPNHADWNYQVGEEAVLKVAVMKGRCLLKDVKVDYEAGPEMYPDVKKQNMVLKDGTMTWKAKMQQPGFYKFKVWTIIQGKKYEGVCTVGFSPERLQPITTCPADFDSFWQQSLSDARRVPLEGNKRLLPERCTDKVNVYEVSFHNNQWGSRTFGILCVPTKPGTYPALLRVPGAGVRPYQGDIWTASQGAITLEIGVHGIPVTMPQGVYDNLAAGALNGYWDFNTDDRDRMTYKRIFIGAIRAIDYIATLPEWDGKTLGVTGSSQGGMLSLVCGALDKRVTFIGVVHGAMCDHTASLQSRACGWPHYFYGQKHPDDMKVKVSRYYDGVNFAKRIHCNSWFSFGYIDEVVPPTTSYSTYNVVPGNKVLRPYQATGHFLFQEQWDEWQQWIFKQLNIQQ